MSRRTRCIAIVTSITVITAGIFLFVKLLSWRAFFVPLDTNKEAQSHVGTNVEGDFMTSDGIRLHYWFYNRGSDIATVFLHGGPGHGSEEFRTIQAEEFADRFGSLLVFDQRGSGESQHTPDLAATMTFDRTTQDIDELRNYVIPNVPVVIFGRSFGGLFAAYYAATRPDNVVGYLLVAPSVFYQEVNSEGNRALAALPDQPSIAQAIRDERSRVATMNLQTEGETSLIILNEAQEAQQLQDEQEIHDLTQAYQSNEAMLTRNSYPLLSSMSELPVLIVSGEYDSVAPPLAIESMKAYVPDAIFLQLSKGWHFAAYAQQETFFASVSTFYKALQN